jgi:hypothetical protein
MSDAILEQGRVEPEQNAGVSPTSSAAIVCVGFVLASLLWWRFGDSVYAASMMNAFMACF